VHAAEEDHHRESEGEGEDDAEASGQDGGGLRGAEEKVGEWVKLGVGFS
jgi:hypothetical protein